MKFMHLSFRFAEACGTVLMALLLGTGIAAAQSGGNFDLSWSTVDGGGGASSGGDYAISGTIGQPDAGTLSGGDYAVQGGFWAAQTAVPAPNPISLAITSSGGDVVIAWPAPSAGFVLQQNNDLTQPAGWSSVTQSVIVADGQNTVTVPATNSPQFFRLKYP